MGRHPIKLQSVLLVSSLNIQRWAVTRYCWSIVATTRISSRQEAAAEFYGMSRQMVSSESIQAMHSNRLLFWQERKFVSVNSAWQVDEGVLSRLSGYLDGRNNLSVGMATRPWTALKNIERRAILLRSAS